METRQADRLIERLLERYPKGFDLSLDRIARLLDALGHPERRLPPVIHVAGTNGKGSAVAFCRAILEAEGLAVHSHISPHLVRWHERFRLGRLGESSFVEDALLAETLARVERANGDNTITVFEALTAAMFVLFSEHRADAAIVEVGLGGRFDATNVIADPAVSLIMPVSADHQLYLGDRLELIAAEKAGIIKPGCPVVIGPQETDAVRDVLTGTAARLGAPCTVYGEDFFGYEENGRLLFQDETGLLDLPLPRLAGRHQIGNAAAAIAAVRAGGFPVSDRAVERGMENVVWPGRMQRLYAGPLFDAAPEGSELVLDGGHNPSAGIAAAEAMAAAEEQVPRPLFMVAGMIETKDTVGYFSAFKGLARQVYTVPVTGSDSGVDPAVLAEAARQAGLAAKPAASVREALSLIAEAGPFAEGSEPRILVGGSLYLVGQVLRENGTWPQ